MRLGSGVEHHLAVCKDGLGLAEINHARGQQADARVAVLLVVPLEELLTEGAAVLDAAGAIRELRAVLHGAELAFRMRVVVGNIRPAVGLGDPGREAGSNHGRLRSEALAAGGLADLRRGVWWDADVREHQLQVCDAAFGRDTRRNRLEERRIDSRTGQHRARAA